MNTQHTPGPWAANLEKWGAMINAPTGTIAGPVGGSNGATMDELHANARLIAAAPELLETLEGIAAYCNAAAKYTTDERAKDTLRKAACPMTLTPRTAHGR